MNNEELNWTAFAIGLFGLDRSSLRHDSWCANIQNRYRSSNFSYMLVNLVNLVNLINGGVGGMLYYHAEKVKN